MGMTYRSYPLIVHNEMPISCLQEGKKRRWVCDDAKN